MNHRTNMDKWEELKFLIEMDRANADSDMKMYQKDEEDILPLWRDHDSLIASTRSRSGTCDCILKRMERLEKKYE